jgi:uncharacterized protein YqgC (DUF456 family)
VILVVLHPALPALLVALVGLCLSAVRGHQLVQRAPALWAMPSGLVVAVYTAQDIVAGTSARDAVARNLAGRGPPVPS